MTRLSIVLVAVVTAWSSTYVSAEETDMPVNQEYAALEKKAPIYPYVSQFNGIEGYCIVQYTVTELGAVRDVFQMTAAPSVCLRALASSLQKSSFISRVLLTVFRRVFLVSRTNLSST